ncbi:MAG: ABC transporter permease [Ruthenibacterium sp.]
MKGLIYQLKSVRKDKFCIMSFLLPIVVAVALNFVGSIDLSSLGEFHFGVTAKTTTSEVNAWLEQYGTVTVYPTQEELIAAINEPSTNLIGVEMDHSSIQTIISGDELDMFRQTANTLPTLYEQREWAEQASVQVIKRPDMMAGYQNIFIAITLIVAMFMGCTFNAMNIISEKEDGVAFINEILPMTDRQYMMQKIFVGFVFGCLSAILTAAICFRLSFAETAVMLALIVLSAFVSALIGLFIGKLSDGMMVGVVYIKIVMIVFMAVPILNYLIGAGNKVLSCICYLIPSSATFEGIMDLANGTALTSIKDLAILTLHSVLWFLLYLFVSKRQKKHI